MLWNKTDYYYISHCSVRWIFKKVLVKRTPNSTFYRDNSEEQKILESAFLRLSKNLKPKVLPTMVPPLGYTRFVSNLPFSATRSFERMNLIPYDFIFEKSFIVKH